MENQGFIRYEKAIGIKYINELGVIKKKPDAPFQFLYEAFMNSWEAIIERFNENNLNNGEICINVFYKQNLFSSQQDDFDFDKIEISDNGIGLNDKNYERLVTLRDDSKMLSNKGTGRIQFIHSFDKTTISSIYNFEGKAKFRQVTLSKNEAFLAQNAIIRLDGEGDSDSKSFGTTVIFENLLDQKENRFFSDVTSESLQKDIIKHFLSLFCENRDNLPKITITVFKNADDSDTHKITADTIPQPDKNETVEISYSKLDDKNKIVESDKKESFRLKAFKCPSNELEENAIYLVSKGSTGMSIGLYNLAKKDEVDGNRYMFLLSGKYLDEQDRDDRGNFNLIEGKDFKRQNESSLFHEEVILLDSIKEETCKHINGLYSELEFKNQEKNKNIDELQRMFLLNIETVDNIRKKIKNTDSDEKILQTIYEADSKIEAEKDNLIKQQIEELKTITPDKTDEYQRKLQEKIDELVKVIPVQNRTTLCKYVARRKLILDLFGQILNKELEAVRNNEKKRIDEKLLHNLIFQQSSESSTPEDSDLWLINEEFIYFKGVSESRFEDIVYDGKRIFDKEFSEEEKIYLNSLGEKRLTKRPDVLLFPEEGKAIIIEFKAPDVNVAEHLTQIDFYASLLRNYTIDDLQITAFYGYLIGESIEDRDVRGRVSRFEYSAKFNYWFRPSEKVIHFNNGVEGNIYVEILKYSTLLKRAEQRNQIFINKLTKGKN